MEKFRQENPEYNALGVEIEKALGKLKMTLKDLKKLESGEDIDFAIDFDIDFAQRN